MLVRKKSSSAIAVVLALAPPLLVLVASLLPSLRAQGAGAPTVAIVGRVLSASGAHTVHVALWDADGFLRQPSQDLRFAAGQDTHYRFDVRPGRWALSAYEDRNENGELDMGTFGPKEPNGFWRPFHAWRAPRFDDVVRVIEHDTAGADVTLK